MIEYATKQSLRTPSLGAIPIDKESDHILGATTDYDILQKSGDWLSIVEDMLKDGEDVFEYQRLKDGRDLYWCVTFSSNSADKLTHKRKYGYGLDMDERYVAVGSGTIPYQGNSQQAVEDYKRKNGFLVEKFKAENMTWEQCWAKITETEKKDGINNLEFYSFSYKFLDRATNGFTKLQYADDETLQMAIKRRPVNVCVDGRYEMDDEGRIGAIGKVIAYNHAVVWLGDTFDNNGNKKWRNILDSETKQLLKFVPDYKFGYPYIKDIIKINMKLIKKNGEPAIYLKRYDKDSLIPFADGEISGGELFKSIYGVEYKLLPREDVDELPYPVEQNMFIKVIKE